MLYMILIIISFGLGLSLSKINAKTDGISAQIEELDKKLMSYNRYFERSLTVIERKIETLKELVGEDNG